MYLLILFYKSFFFTYIKMSNISSAKYCENNKKLLHNKARERNNSFSKEDKNKNIQCGCEKYH